MKKTLANGSSCCSASEPETSSGITITIPARAKPATIMYTDGFIDAAQLIIDEQDYGIVWVYTVERQKPGMVYIYDASRKNRTEIKKTMLTLVA